MIFRTKYDEANAEAESGWISERSGFSSFFGSAIVSTLVSAARRRLFCTGSGLTAAFKIGSGMAQ